MQWQRTTGWQVYPLGGETKTAYMAVNQDKKLFLKRNTSPFLAALSLEKITPKLLWTRRLNSGDTLVAQEWLDARNLRKHEMKLPCVSQLLYRLHHSELLHRMLKQVEGQTITPQSLLTDFWADLGELKHEPLIEQVYWELSKHQPQLAVEEYEVCHGDLNHKNWLLANDGRLYLVDWETVGMGDCAFDLSMIMCHYVPRNQWLDWLVQYGLKPNEDLMKRIEWYARMNLLRSIKQHAMRGRFAEMNRDMATLAQLITPETTKKSTELQ